MNIKFDKIILYALPLTAALIICRTFPILSFFYYAAPVLFILALAFHLNPNLHQNLNRDKLPRTIALLLLMFGIWAAVTAGWSSFPGVSILRAGYFLLISIAAVLLGYHWRKNESNDVFGFLLPANLIVVFVSVFSLIASSPADAWSGGHGLGFKGYASHQNTLASAILFTIPSVLYPILKELILSVRNKFKNVKSVGKSSKPKFLILILISILNLYFLLISVSRAGVLALGLMVVIFLFISFNVKGRFIFILLLIFLSAVVYYSSQTVRDFVFKTEAHIGDRRIENISETVEAAKNGGVIGLGYGISQNPTNERIKGRYEYDGKLFIREKMISILALIEETGIVGLVLFIFPIGYVLFRLTRHTKGLSDGFAFEDKLNNAMIASVILALAFHAQIEAWWVGVGSIELPLFFMVFGIGIGKYPLVGTTIEHL